MLTNKVAIVTGASRGIGAATARLLAQHHAKVVVNYFSNVTAAEGVVADIEAHGGEAIAIQADVRDEAQMNALVQQTTQQFGQIDILVSNASISFPMTSFMDVSWDEFDLKVSDELKAAFVSARVVAPYMIRQQSGKMIFVSSGLSNFAQAGFVAHGVAKGGLNSLVRYIANELGAYQITANVVSPGMVATDATLYTPIEVKEQTAQMTPLGRIAQPEDIAKAILLYASSHSDFITGAYVPVSGGMEMN
ncbi:SDR family NAD(P)-dependent oxidoreductase [Paenibacillus wenxiniae]|uniref:SDR family NAD(P)-dependent oxidoreductase n=1 Tax=Paenibacillus wenxiniae TaxID=1636843 RepID=A0ABW4RPE3_9BACL